jgi:hypothetical protein
MFIVGKLCQSNGATEVAQLRQVLQKHFNMVRDTAIARV